MQTSGASAASEGAAVTKAAANKAAIRRATEAFNRLDREAFDANFADPCLFHFRSGDREIGHEAHWQSVLSIFQVFPDLKATIDGLIAEDDKLFVRWSYVGTHLGRSRSGVEPTGKKLEWGVTWAHYRFENGVAVEVWELSDHIPLEEI